MTDQHYVLGLDGGGTKTLARLELWDANFNKLQTWSVKAGPSSLTNDFGLAVETINGLCLNLCQQASIKASQVVAVLGLAGTGNQQKVSQLKSQLVVSFKALTIVSDAKTSLYGAYNGQAATVIALGTGSVGMNLNEQGDESLFGGWGFKLGDEGSGANIGLMAVKAYLTDLDYPSAVNSQLSEAIGEILGQTRNDILQWLATANAEDFAQFSPLVFQLSSTCSMANKVLSQHIIAVETLIGCAYATHHLPLILVGGLAPPTIEVLSKQTQQLLSPAKGDALDGACLLAKKLIHN